MKKIISILLVLVLLSAAVPTVFAASASMSGPSVIRPGDTFTVSFYASGGIYGGSGSVIYDSSFLTLEGYSQVIGGDWAVEFNGNNFVFYDNSMSSPVDGATIFTATFTASESVAPGTGVTITASGVTLSDGDQDISAGSPAFYTAITPPLSGDCDLADLSVSNASISPGFSADVTNYSASVPYATSSLDISAQASHGGASVSVSSPTLTPGGTTTASVTVTAENGATKTYSISVFREQDPNYVKSDNANLTELSVEGFLLSPVFSPEVTLYYVWLPYETETLSLSASKEDGRASVSIPEIPALEPGKGTPIAVTVTAEDGTEKIYTVTAVRAPALEDTPVYLTGERETEPTEPPTEPPTQPPTEPPTQPPTEPAPLPEPEPVETGFSFTALILAVLISILAGAGIGIGVIHLIQNKKSFENTEEENHEDSETTEE